MGFRCLRNVFLLTVLAEALHAQMPTTSSSSSKPRSAPSQVSAPDSGALTNGLYRNSFFGFDYKLPFGWIDRTKEMSDDSSASNPPKKATLLLAAFERPPAASGDSVNSAVVFAAETVSSYPGLRTAEQYFGPLTELTKSKGLKVVNEPYAYSEGATRLVRGDFSKALGNLTMHQSTLVILESGYVVSFTFIGGSEDELNGLVESLTFAKKETPVRSR
jgi:hypothetical protein